MSTKKSSPQYTEEFKKTIVNLYQSGKTYAQLHSEYGISSSALSNWVHRFSEVKIDENTVLTAHDYCIHISDGRASRLMEPMNLPKMSTVKPPKPKKTAEDTGACKNILEQRFDQPAPNMVWVCDFTYIRVANRFYYVCAILDLFARKVIAYRVSPKIDRFLAIATLQAAIAERHVSSGVMFHSDQGSQFTSEDFRKEIDKFHMVQSFSKKGHPYDNAVMECFFKYLKKEETDRRRFSSVEELNISLFKYIHGF